jgi:signal transduction histidine kinase
MTPALRRALALAVAALLVAVPWAAEWAAAPPAARTLGRAQFGETVDDPKLREVSVPHRWQPACPQCRTVWYRFDLPLAELPRDAQAVLLQSAGRNAALYLNGRLLAQGGRFSEPMARLGARPLWAVVPATAWNIGDNRLYVLVKAEAPRAGFIGAPAVGAEAELTFAARSRALWVQTMPQLAATAAAILAAVMGLVWWYRRHEAGHAALALACAAFALNTGSAQLAEPPWGAAAWDAWLGLGALATAAATLALATRLIGAPLTRRARWGVVIGLLAVAAWLTGERNGFVGAWLPAFAALLLAGCGAWLAAAGWRRPDARLIVGGAVVFVLGLADTLRPGIDPGVPPALPWAMAVLLGLASWMLLLRFVETLNTAELLNIDLEAMVQQRTAELQAQFERVAELERRQTIAAERERLMRDMHDGVGGHLVSLLAMIEADPRRPAALATAVRDALDDMRLMIDSLDPVDDDLNAVLAMWRDRLAPRLRQLGVALQWDVALLPQVAGLTPARVLHLLRILQEGVTNAVRHGRAKSLWVGAAAQADAVIITLRDDGSGFEPAHANPGRGLKNMRRRAELAGCTVALNSAPGAGTTLSLVLGRPGDEA